MKAMRSPIMPVTLVIIARLLVWGGNAAADEFFATLKAGSEVYSNVTVLKVTGTDVLFTLSKGIGNAKLKDLEPELQKHFHFDAAKADDAERKQREDNARFQAKIASRNGAPAPQQPVAINVPKPASDADGDLVLPQIYARSFRGRTPPQIVVDQWLTPAPDVTGKFVLVDFWATWCGPCRESIPHLNELYSRFKDRLVVIGLSDEPEGAVRKLTTPKIEYSVGIDTQARTKNAVEVRGIPHALLIDPTGIVRYEGTPFYLTDQALERLLTKYAE